MTAKKSVNHSIFIQSFKHSFIQVDPCLLLSYRAQRPSCSLDKYSFHPELRQFEINFGVSFIVLLPPLSPLCGGNSKYFCNVNFPTLLMSLRYDLILTIDFFLFFYYFYDLFHRSIKYSIK